jgi:glycine betaine transporter
LFDGIYSGGCSYALFNGGITEAIGSLFSGALGHGFRTFTFMDQHVSNWFETWILIYMVWWITWAPFFGAFIARISRGRTIREFLIGVNLGPTLFSMLWFGVFGGAGFHALLQEGARIMEVVRNNVSSVTFFILQDYPWPSLTIELVIFSAFCL